MRVTGGTLGGRRLRPVRTDVRPTSDMVREATFSRLGSLDGAVVLDLFAGTGALGIEALSRGAASVVFVDRSVEVLTLLRSNLELLGLEDSGRVMRTEARSALRRLAKQGHRFSLVLLDPPYADSDLAPLLESLVGQGLLLPGATVVVESGKRHPVAAVEGLEMLDERRYGDTLVTRLTTRDVDGDKHRDREGEGVEA